MNEAGGIVCEVDSPFASNLVEALERVRLERAPNAVATWLVSYRSEELQSGAFIAERSERFKKVNDSFASFLQSYRITTSYRADEAARAYLRGMATALSKIAAIDEGMTEDADELTGLLQSRDFETLANRLAALSSADDATTTARYLAGYERRLGENGFLMGELCRILSAEYHSRVEGTRARFAGAVAPLVEGGGRMQQQIADIDANIADLSRDANVSADDRSVFLEAFARRREELVTSMKGFRGNAFVVSALLAEYRSVTERFAGFLTKLETQLAQLAARRDYLGRLHSTGSEVPKLTAVLETVDDSLHSNAETLQETFLLLDDAFQEELFTVLDTRPSIGSVTVRLKGAPEVAFVVSPQPTAGETLPPLDVASFAALAATVNPSGRAPRASHRSRRSIRPVKDPAGPPSHEAR